jgi:hypothetical protein
MADGSVTPTLIAVAAVAVPHLDDGIVSEILLRLPSKDAYRLAAVCRRWRAVLSLPTFLCKVGYTHLTLVATDPNGRVAVKPPVPDKYKDRPAATAYRKNPTA